MTEIFIGFLESDDESYVKAARVVKVLKGQQEDLDQIEPELMFVKWLWLICMNDR